MLPGPGGRLSLLGALLALSGVLAIGYVSHRERDNAFCVSCHGPAGSDRPLHAAIFERYASSARPGPDMATAHAQAAPPVRFDQGDASPAPSPSGEPAPHQPPQAGGYTPPQTDGPAREEH